MRCLGEGCGNNSFCICLSRILPGLDFGGTRPYCRMIICDWDLRLIEFLGTNGSLTGKLYVICTRTTSFGALLPVVVKVASSAENVVFTVIVPPPALG